MQYLFTCVNTSVPESLAAKFVKCIVPGNSRNARPAWRLWDPACAWISASSLTWQNRCASDSPLRSIERQRLFAIRLKIIIFNTLDIKQFPFARTLFEILLSQRIFCAGGLNIQSLIILSATLVHVGLERMKLPFLRMKFENIK